MERGKMKYTKGKGNREEKIYINKKVCLEKANF